MNLFVYGTLKRGFPNHLPLMYGVEYLGEGLSSNRYPLLIAGEWNSPVLIEEPGNGYQVQGEIYRVTEERLMEIDEFEGTHHPHGYYRKTIPVIPEFGLDKHSNMFFADTYFKKPPEIMHVSAGPLRLFPIQNQYIPRSQRNRVQK